MHVYLLCCPYLVVLSTNTPKTNFLMPQVSAASQHPLDFACPNCAHTARNIGQFNAHAHCFRERTFTERQDTPGFLVSVRFYFAFTL